jgi:hypothetical protein
MKNIPEKKHFNIGKTQVREIDIVNCFNKFYLFLKNPPIMYGKTELGIRRLIKSKLQVDYNTNNNSSNSNKLKSKIAVGQSENK